METRRAFQTSPRRMSIILSGYEMRDYLKFIGFVEIRGESRQPRGFLQNRNAENRDRDSATGRRELSAYPSLLRAVYNFAPRYSVKRNTRYAEYAMCDATFSQKASDRYAKYLRREGFDFRRKETTLFAVLFFPKFSPRNVARAEKTGKHQ